MMRARCNHCRYEWFPNIRRKPKACPRCKQYGKIIIEEVELRVVKKEMGE